MDKRALLTAIEATLRDQLAQLTAALAHAQAAAVDDEARAENQYDTRALEMSYLAAGQTERVEQVRRTLAQYHYWHPETDLTEVRPGALVRLVGGHAPERVFLTPFGAGLRVIVGGVGVQVVATQAPLGAALLGKVVGDVVTVAGRDVEVVGIE
ncbi:MAG: transcription elongation factor GreAB [Myxococcales bacterium]|nr:transcription elongation factor GreAB [Myxococcales bacterium]